MPTGKVLLIVLGIAIVAAVLAAVAQTLILGRSNATALTGGVVGAVTAGIAVSVRGRKSGSS